MNMKNTGMFSSNTDLWETPQGFFDDLDREFNFDLDVCAIEENAKCYKFYSPEDDGLKQDWIGTCWMNPPYGRQIGKWVEKAYTEHIQHGSRIVCLLPARTDTKWFHDYILGKAEIRFIKGRLKFGGSKNSAPFPSMVVVY